MSKPLPRAFVVPLIFILNTVVFMMWSTGGSDRTAWMADHFLISWTGVFVDGHWWTLITSVFSQSMLLHFLINMFVLNSFGTLLEKILGSWRFLTFYLIAGVVSSLAHAWVSAYFLHQPDLPALGASGAIAGLVLVFSLMFPKEKILLLGIIPLPALIGALAFVGLDLYGLFEQSKGGGLPIGHGAHLGGALTGALYYLFYVRPKMRRGRTSRPV
jgi:membrane associated rhomboid family serine protease